MTAAQKKQNARKVLIESVNGWIAAQTGRLDAIQSDTAMTNFELEVILWAAANQDEHRASLLFS